MAGPYKEAARRLREIAQSQQGFFTAKQAIGAGFAEKVHSYHVNAGNWIREHRGIYRLADYAVAERPDLMRWYLWSQNRKGVPQGTYSHETALSLHELSDIMPSKAAYDRAERVSPQQRTSGGAYPASRAPRQRRRSGNARSARDPSAKDDHGSARDG